MAKRFLKTCLYEEGKAFKSWWSAPEHYLRDGAIISYIRINDKIVGVGILNFCVKAYTDSSSVMGLSGFFVKKEYRGRGFASQLAKNIDEQYKKSFGKTKKSVLACYSGFTLSSAYSTSFETKLH